MIAAPALLAHILNTGVLLNIFFFVTFLSHACHTHPPTHAVRVVF